MAKGFDEPTVMAIFFTVAALVTWARLRNAWKGFVANVTLALLTNVMGQLPSLFFVASLGAVVFQHGVPAWAAVLATLPALILASTRILPTLNLLWTFLSLTCAFHATLRAGWTETDVGNYAELARKKGIPIGIALGILFGVFGALAILAPLLSVPIYLGLRYVWPHFHTLGAKFV
jgi:hypothetical protein